MVQLDMPKEEASSRTTPSLADERTGLKKGPIGDAFSIVCAFDNDLEEFRWKRLHLKARPYQL